MGAISAGTVVGTLEEFAAEEIASGAIRYFAPYEAVHRSNIERMRAVLRTD